MEDEIIGVEMNEQIKEDQISSRICFRMTGD